jgi:hypothetical protein
MAQQPPQQPLEGENQPQPAIPPTVGQRYKYGGIVLALISVSYFAAWWFAFIGYLGSAAIYNLALAVLIIVGFGMFPLDWQGYTTLLGLVNWQRLSGFKKFWLVCAFLFLPEFMVGIYLIRAIRQHIASTQKRPGEYVQGSGMISVNGH